MQYGDLNDSDFQSLGVVDISSNVDPFRCLLFDTLHSFSVSSLGVGYPPPQGTPISRQQCADIMFDEMKELSTQFASGQYAPLIGKLIDHFHYGNGQPWTGELLNRAYTEVVSGVGTNDFIIELNSVIKRDSRLPKFNRFVDRFNGLGISVHDIYAQKISLVRLQRYAMSWDGLLFFKGQDHFGLGKEDITNALYKNFRFFVSGFFYSVIVIMRTNHL